MEYNINHMTPVLFGADTVKQTGARLKALGCKKVLFVYDQGVKKAGIVDKVADSVKAAGIAVAVFDKVIADPPDTTLDEGAEIGRKENVDGVVGIGGGSTMDSAKGINLLLTNPPPAKQYMKFGVQMKPGRVLVLVPTTSGTGSEVTAVAVITDSVTHSKGGIAGPLTRANLAIIDPLLAVGMPPSITADTGMDVFSHAIEAITATRANQMSDILGANAIELTWKYLPRAVKNGNDIEARTQMSFAAMEAGFAFQDSMTHLAHAIGHTLGSLYHIPHGSACGVALPEVVEYIADAVPDGVRLIGKSMGLSTGPRTSSADAAKKAKDALIKFSASIGIKTLKGMGIPKADFAKIAEGACGPGVVMFTPKKVSKEDVIKILTAAYDH
jgi:alcohol dehydrogenase